MHIRPLIEKDRIKISRLIKNGGIFIKEENRVAMELVDDVLCHPGKSDYQIFCAIKDPHHFAGYICFGPIPMTEGCYDLYWIAVDRKYSRNGVGGMLLEKMQTCISKRNGRRIYLDTSSTQPYKAARTFYEKHGFVLACVLRDFYRKGDHKMIFMKEVG
jgi:ribosomal protein S18 acetylase RimI-like enzyme